MRVAKTALIAGVVVTAATATILKAQQRIAGSAPVAAAAADASSPRDPSMAQKSTRNLYNNGMDYLNTYQDYDRALPFLREAQARTTGLSASEKKKLAAAITRAEEGQQAAVIVANNPRQARTNSGNPPASAWGKTRRPVRDIQVASAVTSRRGEESSVRKASAESVAIAEPLAMDVPVLAPGTDQASQPAIPAPGPDDAPPPLLPASTPEPVAAKDAPKSVQAVPAPKTASEPIFLTGSTPAEAPKVLEDPAKDKDKPPVDGPPPIEAPATDPSAPLMPETVPAPVSAPAPVVNPIPVSAPTDPKVEAPAIPPNDEASALPPLPSREPTPAPLPSDAPSMGVKRTAPVETLPRLEDAPPSMAPVREPVAAPVPVPVPIVQQAAAQPRTTPPSMPAELPTRVPAAAAAPSPVPGPANAPTEPPATEAEELPPLPLSSSSGVIPIPAPTAPLEVVRSIGSSLSPETLREIEEVARLQDEAVRRNPPNMLGTPTPNDLTAGGPADNGGGSRLVLPRPPSPTEARPIRVIPVPEDFIPLPPRQWEPQRKYWAAAATCHMPLYFQDAVLERYGQSVESAIGPNGRFFSYPLDDPRQSNQRNQLLQPMYSAGLFLSQIALLPYNMLMDPPWEAEYDLGYYRPGDKIPGDTYYLPKTGIGPFFRGNRY